VKDAEDKQRSDNIEKKILPACFRESGYHRQRMPDEFPTAHIERGELKWILCGGIELPDGYSHEGVPQMNGTVKGGGQTGRFHEADAQQRFPMVRVHETGTQRTASISLSIPYQLNSDSFMSLGQFNTDCNSLTKEKSNEKSTDECEDAYKDTREMQESIV